MDELKKRFYDITTDNETALVWALVRLDKDYTGQNRNFLEDAAAELVAKDAEIAYLRGLVDGFKEENKHMREILKSIRGHAKMLMSVTDASTYFFDWSAIKDKAEVALRGAEKS